MALTDYFVSTLGGGSHDGTSEANALTLSEMISQINVLGGTAGGSGRRYNIKGNHTERVSSDILGVGGTIHSPLVLRGYTSVTGDLDAGSLDSYGDLIVSGFPRIAYTGSSNIRFLAVSGSYLVLQNLHFQNNYNGTGPISILMATPLIQNCYFDNQNLGANAVMLSHQAGNARFINCHFPPVPSASGLLVNAISFAYYYGCKFTRYGGDGIRTASAGAGMLLNNCVFAVNKSAIIVNHATAYTHVYNTTIKGGTHGIAITGSNSAVGQSIINCHITDCSGFAINVFGGDNPSTYCTMFNNRFRNNGSGNINGLSDWNEVSLKTLTTDNGVNSDYLDPSNNDFSLLTTAVGYQGGYMNRTNIGACGSNAIIVNSGSGGETSYIFG